jgi:hypothetical protein
LKYLALELIKFNLLTRKDVIFRFLDYQKLNEMAFPNTKQKSLKEINISPENEDLFIQELIKINPNIQVDLK